MATFTATRPSERRAPDSAGAAPVRANEAARRPRWFAASRWLAALELETLPNCRLNGDTAHPDSAQSALRDSIRSANRR